MATFLENALMYAKNGFSVIPIIPGQKKPMIKWQQYQKGIAEPEQIIAWWSKHPNANIGIVTGKISNLFVIDLDKHDPAYSDDITSQLIPESIVCPTANTPKGGQHLYFSYPSDSNISVGARIAPGIDFRGEGGYVVAPPSINGNGNCYNWVIELDRSLLSQPPKGCTDLIINNNINNILYKEPQDDHNHHKLQTTTTTTNNHKMFDFGSRDNDLFHTANCLVKGGMSASEISQVLEKIVISWGENPDVKWIETKIKSALDRAERKQKNWSEETREFVETTDGYFSTTDCHKQLQATTSDHKKSINMALLRLVTTGVLEKHGERNGCYRKIAKLEESVIDIFSADTTAVPIKLPMGISELVKILPKNIIVIAGEVNSGKSAFLLNCAAQNMNKHEVVYFSSEMGGAELKERLQINEKIPFDEWKKCKFVERASDFDVAIRPNAINIVDFLEVHDEFYKVGGYIKKIFDKLENGIAIIAIQKNPGRDEGLGGARSLEKARLYLSMKPGEIKITKAKNWVSSLVNPNNMVKKYKLVGGMRFLDQGDWKRESY